MFTATIGDLTIAFDETCLERFKIWAKHLGLCLYKPIQISAELIVN